MSLWLPIDVWKNVALGCDGITDMLNLAATSHSSRQCLKDTTSEISADDTWWKEQCITEANRLGMKRYGKEPTEHDWPAAYYCMKRSKTLALTKSKSVGCTTSLIYIGCDPSHKMHRGVFEAMKYPKSFAVMIEDPRVHINCENVFYRWNGHRDLLRIATCGGRLEIVKILLSRNDVGQVGTAFACAEGLDKPDEMIELFISMGKAPRNYVRNKPKNISESKTVNANKFPKLPRITQYKANPKTANARPIWTPTLDDVSDF